MEINRDGQRPHSAESEGGFKNPGIIEVIRYLKEQFLDSPTNRETK